jgi:alpha-beta hydrolase superfamily lysophospholipase
MENDDPVVRLAVIEEWRKHVDSRFDEVKARFDALDQKIDNLSTSFPWAKFGTGLGALIAGIGAAVKL